MSTGAMLTAIEHQLLHALSTGASNKHMAGHLSNSEYTIRNPLSSLFKKVKVSNRTQAACWYREHLMHKEREGVVGTSVPLRRQQDSAKMLDQGLAERSSSK